MSHRPHIIKLEPRERAPDADIVGTPAYRARHIAELWTANLWHEAIMLIAAAGSLGLLFYAIARMLP